MEMMMNTRNINAAGRPQTIRTARESVRALYERCQSRSKARAFERHLKTFANPRVCFVAVNGISLPMPR